MDIGIQFLVEGPQPQLRKMKRSDAFDGTAAAVLQPIQGWRGHIDLGHFVIPEKITGIGVCDT